MKKIFFFLGIVLFSTQVQANGVFEEASSFEVARAVKLGRSGFTSGPSSSLGELSEDFIPEIAKFCDVACLRCDTSTGTCLQCNVGSYLLNGECKTCSLQHYCDGSATQVGYCEQVSCINAKPVAHDTGCCCVSYCEGVVCANGYTAIPTVNGCCCE